ncbi:methionine synthase reductase [Aphomia sociella]
MVVIYNFQDIFEESSKFVVFTLPTYKETSLKIEYEEVDDAVALSPLTSWEVPPLPFQASEVFSANISHHRRLTATNDDCKAVYEITFDITDSNFKFRPGDTIGVIPHNNSNDVEFIVDHLNLRTQIDVQYKLSCNTNQKGAKIPVHIPLKSTLKHVLSNYVDLRSVVKKLFLLALSRHTKEENERKVLEYLCSKEGSAAYNTHILNRSVCILDIFAILKSCKPPIEVLLANLPRLLPRPYSIVNRYVEDKNTLKICFSVMSLNNNRKGLTTGWLEEIIMNDLNIEKQMENLSIDQSNNTKVSIYLRKNISGFSMPEDYENPLIMIGPGTGVSPFIGFLEERQNIKDKCPEMNLGMAWLFFGCRDPSLDFIYEEELKCFLDNGTLDKLSTAFSRLEGHNMKYIQDALIENGEDVTKLIKNGSSVFICGDLKTMAAQVKETILKCLVKYDNKSQDEAERFLCDMQKEKKYLVDAWS